MAIDWWFVAMQQLNKFAVCQSLIFFCCLVTCAPSAKRNCTFLGADSPGPSCSVNRGLQWICSLQWSQRCSDKKSLFSFPASSWQTAHWFTRRGDKDDSCSVQKLKIYPGSSPTATLPPSFILFFTSILSSCAPPPAFGASAALLHDIRTDLLQGGFINGKRTRMGDRRPVVESREKNARVNSPQLSLTGEN